MAWLFDGRSEKVDGDDVGEIELGDVLRRGAEDGVAEVLGLLGQGRDPELDAELAVAGVARLRQHQRHGAPTGRAAVVAQDLVRVGEFDGDGGREAVVDEDSAPGCTPRCW